MKTKKKIMALLGLLAAILSIVVGMGAASAAGQEDTLVTFKLHKQQFTEVPTPVENDGLERTGTNQPKGLDGITFDVYNVSQKYYDLLTGTIPLDPEEAITYLSDPTKFADGELPASAHEAQTTAGGGIATFAGLPKETSINIVDGETAMKPSVYLFVEELKTGNEPTGNTQRLVVTLPVYAGDTELNIIHLYPKNLIKRYSVQLKKVGTDSLTTTADLANATFNVSRKTGDTTEYYCGFNVDTQEIDWQEADTNATVFLGDSTITGLKPGKYFLHETASVTDYERTEEALTIEFTILEDGTMASLVVEDANTVGIPTDLLDKSHKLGEKEANNTIVVENRRLTSFTYEKYDAATGQALAGAVFNVAKAIPVGDAAPDLLYQKDAPDEGEYDFAWKSEIGDATGYTLVTLGGEGKSSDTLAGILAGTYYLYEFKAPADFVQPSGAAAYTEVNTVADGAVTIGSTAIGNTRKGALPSTGGNGIVAFVVIGALVMCGALLIYRRNRVNQEQV